LKYFGYPVGAWTESSDFTKTAENKNSNLHVEELDNEIITEMIDMLMCN